MSDQRFPDKVEYPYLLERVGELERMVAELRRQLELLQARFLVHVNEHGA